MIISVTQFFQVQQAIKMHHWATSDYSLHVLLDDFSKDYSTLVDDIVEIVLGVEENGIEVLPIKPIAETFTNLGALLQLTAKSFDEVRQNIDKMPKGTRTVMDEVDKFLSKYKYLFAKFQ